MKKKILIFSTIGLFVASLFSVHFAPNKVVESNASASSYWSSISESTIKTGGETLYNALHSKVSTGTTTLSYSSLWNAFRYSDDIPGKTNKIWDMYGGYQYTYGSDQASSTESTSEGQAYNREHSVPKSWFDGNEGDTPYSDLVHLIPTDEVVNSKRSN